MKIVERFFNGKKDGEEKASLRRNDVCWCGSGKKYKHCHLDRDEHKRRMNGAFAKGRH